MRGKCKRAEGLGGRAGRKERVRKSAENEAGECADSAEHVKKNLAG